MNSNIPIFIISLPQAKARRQRIAAQLDSLKLDYEITDAIDGASLDLEANNSSQPSVSPEKLSGDTRLTRGEIGCFFSHYSLWRRMVDHNIKHAVILEDDIVLQDDFTAVITALPTIGWRWDIVRFSAYSIDKYLAIGKRGMVAGLLNRYKVKSKISRVLCPIGRGRVLVRYKYPQLDTAAYMLTRKAAEVLLRYCAVIKGPVDLMYGQWRENDLHFFSVHLPVASQGHIFSDAPDDSTIGPERWEIIIEARKNRDKSPWKKMARAVRKHHNRWRYRVWNKNHPPEKTKPA